jgi:UDP-GlcNAc:undecaprenyl-phosphate GlcNAc-1-phosphate transferase
MKAIDIEIPPFAFRSSRRWLTPIALGALLGVVALAVPMVRQFFVFEGLRWLYILLFAFLGAGALTPFMAHLSHQWGLVDQPSARKIHAHPTPRLGGVAVFLGFLGSVLLNSILPDRRDRRCV